MPPTCWPAVAPATPATAETPAPNANRISQSRGRVLRRFAGRNRSRASSGLPARLAARRSLMTTAGSRRRRPPTRRPGRRPTRAPRPTV
jgi:hypothetical protein